MTFVPMVNSRQFVKDDLSIDDFAYAPQRREKTETVGLVALNQAAQQVAWLNTLAETEIARQNKRIRKASSKDIQRYIDICEHMKANLRIHNAALNGLAIEQNHDEEIAKIDNYIIELIEDKTVRYYTEEPGHLTDPSERAQFLSLFGSTSSSHYRIIQEIVTQYEASGRSELITEVLSSSFHERAPLLLALFEGYFKVGIDMPDTFSQLMKLTSSLKNLGVKVSVRQFAIFFDKVEAKIKSNNLMYEGVIKQTLELPLVSNLLKEALIDEEAITEQVKTVLKRFALYATDEEFKDWWLNCTQNEEFIKIVLEAPRPERAFYMLQESSKPVSADLKDQMILLLQAFSLWNEADQLSPEAMIPCRASLNALKESSAFAQYLEQYNSPRLQNPLYDPAQGLYHEEFKNAVIAAYVIFNNITKESELFEMIVALGLKRRDIARVCQHEPLKYFGAIRCASSVTPVHEAGVYARYIPQVKELAESNEVVKITLSSGLEHVLTEYKYERRFNRYEWRHAQVPEMVQNHEQLKMDLCNKLSEAIQAGKEPNLSDRRRIKKVKNRIAEFHWLFANMMPFSRGSASVAEIITTALWLTHGLVPPIPDKESPADCNALCSPSVRAYRSNYGAGTIPSV